MLSLEKRDLVVKIFLRVAGEMASCLGKALAMQVGVRTRIWIRCTHMKAGQMWSPHL